MNFALPNVLLMVALAVSGYLLGEVTGRKKMKPPLALSAEVRTYVDQKTSAPCTSPELGKVDGRLKELEAKLKELSHLNEVRNADLAKIVKTSAPGAAPAEADTLENMRRAEVGRLRNELARVCAERPGDHPRKAVKPSSADSTP